MLFKTLLKEINQKQLRWQVLATILELLQDYRKYGGLLPIPELRKKHPEISKVELDKILLDLEKDYRIDLKVANDPRYLSDKGAGGIIKNRMGYDSIYYFIAAGNT